jgi:hypothetical protein
MPKSGQKQSDCFGISALLTEEVATPIPYASRGGLPGGSQVLL